MYEGEAWPEDSTELGDLERLEIVERPAIAKLPEWKEMKPWVLHSKAAGASRQHPYLRKDTPEYLIARWVKIHVPCANPNCSNRFEVIRKHENGDRYSIHVSGRISDGHKKCRHCKETKRQTLWLYLVTNQAGRSPRIARTREDARQRTWDFSHL